MPSPAQRLQTELSTLVHSLPPGSRLPSEPQLARQFHVSRATLREAMRAFETQGLLQRRQGVGTFVIGKPTILETGLEQLESLETIAHRLGLPVSLGILNLEERLATEEETRGLEVATPPQVTALSRVILLESRPIAYLIDILPAPIFRETPLPANFRGSVLDLLLTRSDLNITASRCDVQALAAPPHIARALGIQRGDVLLQMIAKLYTITSQVIDFSYSYFVPGYFKFHIVRKVGNK